MWLLTRIKWDNCPSQAVCNTFQIAQIHRSFASLWSPPIDFFTWIPPSQFQASNFWPHTLWPHYLTKFSFFQFKSLYFCQPSYKVLGADERFCELCNLFEEFVCLFVYISQRARLQALGATSRGRSRLPAEQGAGCGAPSQDPEIMIWAEGRCLTSWSTQAPLHIYF